MKRNKKINLSERRPAQHTVLIEQRNQPAAVKERHGSARVNFPAKIQLDCNQTQRARERARSKFRRFYFPSVTIR